MGPRDRRGRPGGGPATSAGAPPPRGGRARPRGRGSPAAGGPNPAAANCAALLAARPGIASGVYWIKPSTASDAFRAYCDMTNEGGGWTLVWSNLRGGRGKPFTEMQFKAAVNTLPRVEGVMGADLESFIVYTGLKHWDALGPNSVK